MKQDTTQCHNVWFIHWWKRFKSIFFVLHFMIKKYWSGFVSYRFTFFLPPINIWEDFDENINLPLMIQIIIKFQFINKKYNIKLEKKIIILIALRCFYALHNQNWVIFGVIKDARKFRITSERGFVLAAHSDSTRQQCRYKCHLGSFSSFVGSLRSRHSQSFCSTIFGPLWLCELRSMQQCFWM